MKAEKLWGNVMKGKALRRDKRVHLGFVTVTQMPPAQDISSV